MQTIQFYFVKNEESSIRGLKKILLLFQVITGLSINFQKSQIFHVSNKYEQATKSMEILGCHFGMLPFKYLGMWVGADSNKCSLWKDHFNKMKDMVGIWKCNYLNMAGRMILLNSSLDGLPNYWFGLKLIPKTMRRELERTRRKFFWGELNNSEGVFRKVHLVKWETICSSKVKGGLGLTK